jgi:hypothetical protein
MVGKGLGFSGLRCLFVNYGFVVKPRKGARSSVEDAPGRRAGRDDRVTGSRLASVETEVPSNGAGL